MSGATPTIVILLFLFGGSTLLTSPSSPPIEVQGATYY